MQRVAADVRATGARRARPHGFRRAHTLVELVLVLTILSLIAFIAIPRFASALMRSKLDAALDGVRGDLRFARARAISTGMRQQLAVDSSAGQIIVRAVHPEELAGTATTDQQNAANAAALQDQVEDPIHVVSWSVFPLLAGQGPGAAPQAAQDGTPLVFYPEGICDSARLVLQDGAGDLRGLEVDGFTGEIRELTAEEVAGR